MKEAEAEGHPSSQLPQDDVVVIVVGGDGNVVVSFLVERDVSEQPEDEEEGCKEHTLPTNEHLGHGVPGFGSQKGRMKPADHVYQLQNCIRGVRPVDDSCRKGVFRRCHDETKNLGAMILLTAMATDVSKPDEWRPVCRKKGHEAEK